MSWVPFPKTPTNVRLILKTGKGEEFISSLPEPTLNELTDGLADLYVKIDCEDTVAGVQASYDNDGRDIITVGDIETSPDQIASYFWDEMNKRLGNKTA